MSLREELFAEAYAKKFPDKPPYAKLPEREKREVRFYFENRGVIFNPRFGVTGRIGGYAALRDFTLDSEPVVEADRAEEIARRAEEQEKAEAEKAAAEEEELHKATNPPPPPRKEDPARETTAKQRLAELQKDWPPAEDERPEADTRRNDLLDRAMEILYPYATMSAKQHTGPHFSEEDAEDIAYDALVAWKAKVLKRIGQIRNGTTNSKGQLLPDAFVGEKLGTRTKRNLIQDIGRFVYNHMMSTRNTTAHRAALAPMDPLATEHEGERGEDEPPIGHQVSTGENPASEITGAEQTKDVYSMFRTIARDARRDVSTDAADFLDAILKTNSNDDRELAQELGWTRKRLRNARTVTTSYVKHRAKSIPALRAITRAIGEAAERLCEKYAVLHLLLSGNFLPTRQSKSLARIYEKFESFCD